MDIHKPAHGIFLCSHPEITQRNVAEYCEGQQTDQGDVEFNVQECCLSVTGGIRVVLSLVVSNQQINR